LHPRSRSRSQGPARRRARTWERRAHGDRGWVRVPGCRWGAPLRPAPPGSRRPNPARPSQAGGAGRRGSDAPRWGRAGAGFRRPLTFLLICPAGSAAPGHPLPYPQPSGAPRRSSSRSVLGGCGRVGLGPGAGLGADPEAGLSLRQGQLSSPPVSLSLLLPPPAPGGARHGGAGARQARYGDVEIGEAWCGEAVVRGQGAREDWRGERRRNPG
jgi:hypothetical protein